MKVLAIGCHPDDLEIACGGTLRKYVEEGADVYMCHVANSRPVLSGLRHTMTAEGNGAASSPFPSSSVNFRRPRRNLTSLALPKIQS